MSKSEILFERAKKVMVGGVNSPVRSFRSVGGVPRYIDKAKGSYLWDADGKKYIDYVGSWGPMILGHNHPAVVKAIQRDLLLGLSYGACHEREIILAELIQSAFPKTVEKVRLACSGTEAVMAALRIARAATGRTLTVKFAGGYHGHHDSLLAEAGSGATTLGIPDSAGVPESWAATTLILPYNVPLALENAFLKHGPDIACVIVEPIACNMGVVAPQSAFLDILRDLTERNGSVLIFDEVITGFRAQWGGLAEIYGADLVTLGKIIGGGMPIGAVAGSAKFMDHLAPLGKAYHAGTLAGSPLAVSCGIATLQTLKKLKPYAAMEKKTKALAEGLRKAANKKNISVTVNQAGSLLTAFFTSHPVIDYESAKTTDTKRFGRFFAAMLARGIYLPPSNYEAWFVSAAHTEADIERTIKAIYESIDA